LGADLFGGLVLLKTRLLDALLG